MNFSKFCADKSGNFAILTAVMVPVLIGVAGLAVDVSNAMRLKSHLQNASDAAILAVTQKGRHLTQAEARALAESYLNANAPIATNIRTLNLQNSQWLLEVESTYRPYFEGFLGLEAVALNVQSTASFSTNRFEIALVLDTTGSMRAGNKMRDMKLAATRLVEGMTGGVSKGHDDVLKFSVVPFAQFVNVGPQYAPKILANGRLSGGADWLDLKGENRHPQRELPRDLSRFSLYHNMSVAWPGCVETRVPVGSLRYDIDDIEPNTTNSDSLFVPSFYNSEPVSWVTYNRYAADPNSNARYALARYGVPDARDLSTSTFRKVSISRAYSTFLEGPVGPDALCSSEPLLRLTTDFDAVTDKIATLEARGGTNILEGVMWGWRTLSHRKPFADGKPPTDETVRKVMILLTDGSNAINVSSWLTWNSIYSSIGFTIDGRFAAHNASERTITSMLDQRTLAACNNAKKAGIEIYTIKLEHNDTATGNLLEECATTPGQYFDAPNSSQLQGIFDSIKTRIQGVLLTS